ncbi:MAG: RNase adapter RapZ [Clostridia bacterium]|nr:RNase adapter RapZ [Clostridia bacterium]
MEFLVVTGLSGAGKSRAVDALEDIGFYCVDNIPAMLIPRFYELCIQGQNERQKIAVVTDSRSGGKFEDFLDELEKLKTDSLEYKILFIDCDEDVLVNRYKETRRKHPLAEKYNGSIPLAVRAETVMLKKAREKADYLIDTTHLSPAQMKERISTLFLGDMSRALIVHCISFAFKHGVPNEADLVFDVRCLPNPFYVDSLKEKTGLDADVREYVLNCEQTKGFLTRLYDMLDYMLPLYALEGKSQLVIAVGCTGGQHRSVTVANCVYDHLKNKGARCSITHRDLHNS